MPKLPKSVEEFVKRQKTVAAPKPKKSDPDYYHYPYAIYYYPAVTAILLSGRVKSRNDGLANKTDVNRICKEANFNQYLMTYITEFLLAAKVVDYTFSNEYEAGENFDAFFSGDVQQLPPISREAFVTLVWKRRKGCESRLISAPPRDPLAMCAAFFTAFEGRALRVEGIGDVWREFAALPENDLARLVKSTGIDKENKAARPGDWSDWLDERGTEAFRASLGLCDWIYSFEKNGVERIYCSETGQVMLGFKKPPKRPKPATEIQVQSDLSVIAGSNLPVDALVTLFRYCKIKRIDHVMQFQIDKNRLREAPADASPGEELASLFKDVKSLPPAVKNILQTRSQQGGTLYIRPCNAVIKVDEPETEHAIRSHRKLKNFVDASSPPGWLFIKYESNPDTFIMRCRELGYDIKAL